MRELKQALRREQISLRKTMNNNYKRAADKDIFIQLKPFIDKADSVLTYMSTEIEVDTRAVAGYCLERGIPVALPITGDSEIKFYYIASLDELHTGRFNISEPPSARPAIAARNTLCIVPALCADGNGYRLGYGRGYYDRFLSGFVGTSVILCYKDFKRDVPIEPHDIKADITVFDR